MAAQMINNTDNFFDIVKKAVYGENLEEFDAEFEWVPTDEELDMYKTKALREIIPMLGESITASDLDDDMMFNVYMEIFNRIPVTRMLIRVFLNTIDMNSVSCTVNDFTDLANRTRFCVNIFNRAFLEKIREGGSIVEIKRTNTKTNINEMVVMPFGGDGGGFDEKFHNLNKIVEEMEEKYRNVFPYISNFSSGKCWRFTDINSGDDYEIYVK